MLRKYAFLTLMVLFVLCSNFFAFGVQSGVNVTIPDFPVVINGAEFNEQYDAEYPLLRYNGVVYFPMAYFEASALNLETEWTETEGLIITKGNSEVPKVFSYYFMHPRYVEFGVNPERPKTNGTFQRAEIADFPITINGKKIDKKEESYPFLIFRNVTYLPLTWKLAAEEFGWSYTFDDASGLKINTDAFFYTANGDSYVRDNGEFVSMENETYYVKGDLRISVNTKNARLLGPMARNLCIVNDGTEIRPEGYFGYFQKNGPLFTVEGNEIHTVYYIDPDKRDARPCKINIKTGEIL